MPSTISAMMLAMATAAAVVAVLVSQYGVVDARKMLARQYSTARASIVARWGSMGLVSFVCCALLLACLIPSLISVRMAAAYRTLNSSW
jgi:uncharacterized membrane protein